MTTIPELIDQLHGDCVTLEEAECTAQRKLAAQALLMLYDKINVLSMLVECMEKSLKDYRADRETASAGVDKEINERR